MNFPVQLKPEKIAPFGGIFAVIKEFSKIESTINRVLGRRGKAGSFQYGEIIRALMCIYFCGGNRIEDIKTYKKDLEYMPGNLICSPDTILRAFEELKTPNITYTHQESGISYDFNICDKLNDLLLICAMQQGQVKPGREYILDFDHKFIPAEKFDAKVGYKMSQGYWAAVAMLTDEKTGENVIIGIEGLDGNTNVKFHQADILRRYFTRLQKYGIKCTKGRFDCGSYSNDIVHTIKEFCPVFYIRAMMCENLRQKLTTRTNWVKGELDGMPLETMSLYFFGMKGVTHCRLVAQRTIKHIPDLFEGVYVHRAILTSDWDKDDIDVIDFYNQRGAIEKVFDQMDNDFGWNYLPKSFLDANTVFMALTALIRNFYCALLQGKKITDLGLTSTARMKSFISKFIAVPAKWIRKARRHVLNLYTDKQPYYDIFNLGFS